MPVPIGPFVRSFEAVSFHFLQRLPQFLSWGPLRREMLISEVNAGYSAKISNVLIVSSSIFMSFGSHTAIYRFTHVPNTSLSPSSLSNVNCTLRYQSIVQGPMTEQCLQCTSSYQCHVTHWPYIRLGTLIHQGSRASPLKILVQRDIHPGLYSNECVKITIDEGYSSYWEQGFLRTQTTKPVSKLILVQS